jgi:hypothetical protein
MEIPEMYLEAARDLRSDAIMGALLVGGGDTEMLWDEIHRMLLSKTTEDRDAVYDLCLRDIIVRVADKEASRLMDAGDLDEIAYDLAIGESEKFSEGMER